MGYNLSDNLDGPQRTELQSAQHQTLGQGKQINIDKQSMQEEDKMSYMQHDDDEKALQEQLSQLQKDQKYATQQINRSGELDEEDRHNINKSPRHHQSQSSFQKKQSQREVVSQMDQGEKKNHQSALEEYSHKFLDKEQALQKSIDHIAAKEQLENKSQRSSKSKKVDL